jgi:cold shock CspA family protein
MAIGILRNWHEDRGFGFIRPKDGGRDVFLHRTQLRGSGADPYALEEGIPLSLDIGTDRDSRRGGPDVRSGGLNTAMESSGCSMPGCEHRSKARMEFAEIYMGVERKLASRV